MTAQATPQFEVVFKGASLEPIADVAPVGAVTFVLVNESDQPHDFALVELGRFESARRVALEPLLRGEAGVIALVPHIAAGDAITFTEVLTEGRYALISNTRGEALGVSVFEITVQASDGA